MVIQPLIWVGIKPPNIEYAVEKWRKDRKRDRYIDREREVGRDRDS